MTPQARALAEHRRRLARDTVAEGEVLLAQQHYRGAINRFYYAAFYAARALLATLELDSAKHSGVISLFHREFVKPGIVTDEVGGLLNRVFERRLVADYTDFATVTAETAQHVRDDAGRFVAACESALDALSDDSGRAP